MKGKNICQTSAQSETHMVKLTYDNVNRHTHTQILIYEDYYSNRVLNKYFINIWK